MVIRWFWREWRTPSLLIVWLALSLAVACVLALGNISDRMEQGLSLQSREFLAGDRALRSAKAIPEAWLNQARAAGLRVGRQLTFSTMTYAGDTPQLANVKAVDDAYPLYGQLITRPAGLRPAPGEVLVAPRLLALLNLKPGQTLEVGDTTLRVVGEVIQEPDAGFNPFQIAPRLMMNLADVAATGAVQPGSRIAWRYKFAGQPVALAQYETWLLPKLDATQRWYGMADDEGALGRSMERARDFLLLCALLTLLLAVAAVTVAMNHYCRSRYTLVAVLKTLGAGRAALRRLVIGQWLLLLALSAVAGTALGLGFEALLVWLLKPVLPTALPAASLWPFGWALSTVATISLLVGLRPYRLLLATRPVRVLRDDVVANVWPLSLYLPLFGLIVVAILAFLMRGNLMLWSVLGGTLLLAALSALAGWGVLWGLRHLTRGSLALRLAVNRLLRRPGATLSQLAAFSLSFMLLALLLVLRGDLLERWQQQLPPDSPNYFLINISPEQRQPIKEFLAESQVIPAAWYPVVRARLTGINGRSTDDSKDEALNRELSLTWQTGKLEHNQLTGGHWPPRDGEVSVDSGLAKRLNIRLNDTLTFSGDTQLFSARVSSLRNVDWESLRPNFYFIFSPASLASQPQSLLTSFRWEGSPRLLTEINRHFPVVSLLDVGAIVQQVSQVLAQISRALEIMVVLVTGCGVLLLVAQIQVNLQARRQELVVYRTLGATRRLLRHSLSMEFALIGAVAGIVAAAGAELALYLLQSRIFDFPWAPAWSMWITLPLAGATLLSLCGAVLGIRLINGKALYRNFTM